MKQFTTFAFLIGLGFSVSLHPSLAQSTGAADDLVKRVVSALAANDQPALSKLGIDPSAYSERCRSAFRGDGDRDSELMPITIPG